MRKTPAARILRGGDFKRIAHPKVYIENMVAARMAEGRAPVMSTKVQTPSRHTTSFRSLRGHHPELLNNHIRMPHIIPT